MIDLAVGGHSQSFVEEMLNALQERSTQDNAAVKVLTIIGLVYLPTTIVAVSFSSMLDSRLTRLQNFFSTQFVQTNPNSGEIQISKHAWLLAAIAVPLTIVTIVIWWLWAYWKPMQILKTVWQVRFPQLRRKDVKSQLFRGRKSKLADVESAVTLSGNTVFQCEMSPRTLCESSVPTWSTVASSTKDGRDWVWRDGSILAINFGDVIL